MRNKGRKGTFSMGVGVLLLLMALLLTGYNVWDGTRAARAAQAVLEKLEEELPSKPQLQKFPPLTEEPAIPSMPTVLIDGYEYIGVIEIPSEQISLPVMAECDMDRLKITPCAYSGSYFTNDLVIAGHNYGRHFSPLKWVGLDSDVYFTTVENITYHYTVDSVSALAPEAVDEMVERTNWDLTLFTCTTGGQKRCTVRCVRADK